MELKIKDGVKIWAYGPASNPFTSESNLSQEQLKHLQTRFPDEIEEIKETKSSKIKN